MAVYVVAPFIGRRTCFRITSRFSSPSGGGTGRTKKKPYIMGNEEFNERRSRSGDALPAKNICGIVEKRKP